MFVEQPQPEVLKLAWEHVELLGSILNQKLGYFVICYHWSWLVKLYQWINIPICCIMNSFKIMLKVNVYIYWIKKCIICAVLGTQLLGGHMGMFIPFHIFGMCVFCDVNTKMTRTQLFNWTGLLDNIKSPLGWSH